MVDISNYNSIMHYGREYVDFLSILKYVNKSFDFLPVTDITNYKTYYCSDLSVPKDRIRQLETKYNIKRVRDLNKADVIFSDYFKLNDQLEDLLSFNMYTIIESYNENTNITDYYRYYMRVAKYCFDEIQNNINIDYNSSANSVIKSFSANKISNLKPLIGYCEKSKALRFIKAINPYLSGKPILCILDYVEEDKDILIVPDFINKYYNKIISDNSRYLTLISLYSKYNVTSIKILISIINNKLSSISYTDKRKLTLAIHISRNIDVYTKYLFSRLDNIKTTNADLKRMYVFSTFNKKYQSKKLEEVDNNYTLTLENSDNLKNKTLNLMREDVVKRFVVTSDNKTISMLESNLINFKILTEKEKDEVLNLMLDLVVNMTGKSNM